MHNHPTKHAILADAHNNEQGYL